MVGTTILRAPTHSAYPLIYRGQWGLRNLKKGDVGAFNKNRDKVGKTGGFNKNGQAKTCPKCKADNATL